MKRPGMPARKTRLRSRSPIKQGGTPIRPKKRSAKEFARVYGSKARVEFVKRLPCVACSSQGRSDNHHIESDGVGRKAHYTTIIPLCKACHVAWHHFGRAYAESHGGFDADTEALNTELAWLAASQGTPTRTSESNHGME